MTVFVLPQKLTKWHFHFWAEWKM